MEELVEFAKWFNENQWRGGQGDKVKQAFVKCDYDTIVLEFKKSKTLEDKKE